MNNQEKIIILIAAVAVVALAIYYSTFSPNGMMGMYGSSTSSTTPAVTTHTTTSVTTTSVTSDGRVRAPENVSLAVGQTGGTDDVSIYFRSVTEDNRCPEDVQCIQAGWVTADLVLSGNNQQVTNGLVKSNGGKIFFNGYNISIKEVSPTKIKDKKIDKDNYRIIFTVTPAASGNNI